MESKFVILLEKFLRRQANAEEIKCLKELLGQEETQDELSSYYERKWAQSSSMLDVETDVQMWDYLRRQVCVSVERPLWKRVLRIAAAVLIPLAFACMGYYYSENKNVDGNVLAESISVPTCVSAGVGQRSELRLPDGTLVWLNSASSLQYDGGYNQQTRIVRLQGEAYFEVSRDEARPFIVETSAGLSVEALGTSFNVKAYSDDNYVAATLIEGCVRVNDSCRSQLLSPKERLIFLKEGRNFIKETVADAEQSIFWLNNQFVFEHESMEDIAKTLERMFGVEIRFASDDVKNIRFSGKIKNTSLDRALQMIGFASPVKYVVEGDTVIIIQSKDPTIH